MCMFRVIFTRIFQNDMLNANVVISNMAQIHQNSGVTPMSSPR